MKTHVDFSVLTETGIAVGTVSGELDLIAPPPVGTTLVLTKPKFETSFPQVVGFTGHLRVEYLQFAPLPTAQGVTAGLEDLVLPSLSDARLVMQFFVQGFGMDAYEFDPDADEE